jgi:hypothetical protein
MELPSLRPGVNCVASTHREDIHRDDIHREDIHHAEHDEAANEEPPKNPHAAALGRLGGLKGGHARALRLSPAKRREIARKAARARWRKEKA